MRIHFLGATRTTTGSMYIFGEPQAVRAQVASLDAFSGHADKNELTAYVKNLTGEIKKISVIHGEGTQALAFADTLRQLQPKAEVVVPVYQQVLEV